MFWWLGLPAPLLLGRRDGACCRCFPSSAPRWSGRRRRPILALQGQWTDAIILTTFGVVVIGLVDNLVYPLIVKGGSACTRCRCSSRSSAA